MIPIADENRGHSFPVVNITIIVVNFLVFFVELMQGNQLETFLTSWAVIPAEITQGIDVGAPTISPHWLTIFSAMFMHGGWLHILGNMLYLWIFGDNVEDNMGHIKYLIFYLLCGIIASVAHILSDPASQLPSLGASGAIAGVLAGYLVLYPHVKVRTLVFLGYFVTITLLPAILIIGIWAVLQFLNGIAALADTAQTGGVAYWAHVGGFVAGLLLVFLFGNRSSARTGYA